MRDLVSVQKIEELSPIKNADRIEKAGVLGWNLVVGKEEFAVGDWCVYFEIDCMLPKKEPFEFLFREGSSKAQFRLRTKKLRGVISQGLAMPLSKFPEFEREEIQKRIDIIESAGEIGADVDGSVYDLTDFFGIEKYEPTQHRLPRRVSTFPKFIPKTDETRIQSKPRLLNEFYGKPCYVTLKYDGCSATYAYTEEGFVVASRNQTIGEKISEDSSGRDHYWEIAKKYDIANKLEEYCKSSGKNIAIQGEICGPKIQGNPLELKDFRFWVFNVYDITYSEYMDYNDIVKVLDELEIPMVKVLDDNFYTNEHTRESLLEYAEGKYDGTNNERGGVVIRPLYEEYSEALQGRLSMKVISNKFLLKQK